jgi:hypothetical protein
MTTLPATVNLTAYRGDTWAQTFRLKQGDTPVDLSGATIDCWATSTNGSLVLTATITNPAAGEIQLTPPVNGLPAGAYTYDVEIRQNGIVTTWVRGSLTVTADITNPDVARGRR